MVASARHRSRKAADWHPYSTDDKMHVWAENFKAAMDRILVERGEEPMADNVRVEVLGQEP